MHKPVLLSEVGSILDIKTDDIVVDGTMGFFGHSRLLLDKLSHNGRLIGIDQDSVAIQYCNKLVKHDERVICHLGNYGDIKSILDHYGINQINKCLLDCGISSFQLDQSGRGFTFQHDEPLDMRMDDRLDRTAADILNTYSNEALTQLFKDYGELRKVEPFIEKLLLFRKNKLFSTTSDLMGCIKSGFYFRQKRHVFIRHVVQVFQAIRIEVNQELHYLQQFLDDIIPLLADHGRCAVISFHSLEDKMIKKFIRENKGGITAVNKKVIQLSYHQAKPNPRARSAKLRCFEKVGQSQGVSHL